jgi:Bacterial pre-peptidase C-terminal domain
MTAMKANSGWEYRVVVGPVIRANGAVLLLASLLAAASGELPNLAPQVRSMSPLGGRAGETVEVEASGQWLANTQSVAFVRPDIRAELISSEFASVKLKISIGPRVPTGLHDYRLRTTHGTFVGVFHVASLPAIGERESNNDTSQAQNIALPAIIHGIVTARDYDLFRFHARQGETLVFDVLARRAGSGLDATLAVLDERGNELDFNDDFYIHKDPHLAFTAPRSGDYFVRVSGSEEGGSPSSPYRLIAGAVPHMLRALPAGARRGSSTELNIAGLNLDRVDRLVLGDGLGEGKVVHARQNSLAVRLEVPASVAPGPHALRAFAGGVEAPLPLTVLVSDFEEALALPARSRAQPQPVRIPAAVSGVLEQRRTAHFYTFEVKSGDRLVFEVDAMKLGYLVDPVVGIYTLNGELLASDDDRLQQNGDEPPNLDPYLVYQFDKAGQYLAMIRDLAQRGDQNYLYRLAIYPAKPDFDVRALTPAITLYRGQTVLLPVRVRRHGGWETPVDVWLENLPPGVTTDKRVAEPKPTIVKDNCALDRRLDGTNVDLPLHVSASASPGSYSLRVRARGEYSGRAVEHSAEILYKWESVGKVTGAIADQTLVATVTEFPPVILEVPGTFTITPGKPARVRVRVTRFDGAKTPLTIEPEAPVDGLRFENNVLAAGAEQVELRIIASELVKPGAFRLRAGPALSQNIAFKLPSQSEEEDPE